MTARIVFFSGTGCTARVARQLKIALEDQGYQVSVSEINTLLEMEPVDETLLLLAFPVHAFHAPKAVYDWIRNCRINRSTRAAVISVSGGGEMICNTACRIRVIKLLAQKGIPVFYENMVVMPCNVLIKTPNSASVRLLEVLPKKTHEMVMDMVSGKKRRTKPYLTDRLLSFSGELETRFASWFGRHIIPADHCNGCSICSQSCPVQNIKMELGRPKFGRRCQLCMRCIYGCPQKALTAGIFPSFVLKDGFDLCGVEKQMGSQQPMDVNQELGGFIWSGVRSYFTDMKNN